MAAETKDFDVVGAGKAYVDIISHAPYALLEENGIPLDAGEYFNVSGIQKIVAGLDSPVFYPGGTISNTLSGLACLGARTGFFGKMAHDKGGEIFLADMKARGIAPLCEPFVPGASVSGTCVVLLTKGGERSFALHNGCVGFFRNEEFDAFDFKRAHVFVVASKLLVTPESSGPLSYALRKAQEAGCKCCVSLSEVRDWTGYENVARDVVDNCADILIGNEAETEAFVALVGKKGPPGRLVVTTMGAHGALAQQDGQEVRVEAYKGGRLISSLGAGDQFLAGILMGEVKGVSLEEKMRLGARCAASIIERTEGRPVIGEDWRPFL